MTLDIPPPPEPVPLRCTAIALPPYRYIPGVHPHPIRHPDGHAHTHPRPLSFIITAPWADQHIWNHGLDLFDHRYYWESHEVFEQMWHACKGKTGERLLLQGLIQAAAFRLKWHQQQERPALKLLDASTNKLQHASETLGPIVHGVPILNLIQRLCQVPTTAHWPTIYP